jgi:aminobenzoyl-glutamate utilization protein B
MQNLSPKLLSFSLTLHLLITTVTYAQKSRQIALSSIEQQRQHYGEIAQHIWDFAEVGYLEFKSTEMLQQELVTAGFTVESGVANIPTAFMASYGSGQPVIALLAEFDALPGILQDRSPTRAITDDKIAGHACGHHLFGTASVAAAIGVKEWLDKTGNQGTIRVYGTPAEEGGAGKVYMVRDGLFDDVDVTVTWHPGDRNDASPSTSNANKSAKFRFRGVSAHAAGAPHRGRSALDGVEAMNYMANLMREHVPQETRIHYVITAGGKAPNVVPDFAEVYYYVRHPDPRIVDSIFERLVLTAEGAAKGTETQVEYEVIHGVYPVLPNETIHQIIYKNLQEVGGVIYNDEELSFAEKIQATLPKGGRPIASAATIQPYKKTHFYSSTDVGDISWKMPTADLNTATWVPGTSAHSWQAVAAGGTGIGEKGMVNAAKVMALTAVDLMLSPKLIERAKQEFQESVGPDFTYKPLIGNRKPPLDYRKSGN